MQRLEVNGAVRPMYGSLGVKRLITNIILRCTVSKTSNDSQCTYNVTLRRFLATIVMVEKLWVLRILCVCTCSLRYRSCNAHASYCHMWRALLYNIFTHYLINGTFFRNKVAEHKMWVFIFSYNFFSKTFFILRRIERDIMKNMYPFSRKVPIILFQF